MNAYIGLRVCVITRNIVYGAGGTLTVSGFTPGHVILTDRRNRETLIPLSRIHKVILFRSERPVAA